MSALDGLVAHRSTTAQNLADGLFERILAGAFSPGVPLRESAIASELGVARNTVREAVRILELSGLVRHEVNRGAVVISPTAENVRAIYVARDRLESAALSGPLTAEHIAGLGKAYDALVTAAETRDPRHIVDADLDFHRAIISCLDSAKIDAFFADMMVELRFYLMVLSVVDRESENVNGVLAEHDAILQAARTGQASLASTLIHQHMESNALRLQEILRERNEAVS